MPGFFFPTSINFATTPMMTMENRDLVDECFDLDMPMDQIYLDPYVMENPMWWPGFEPFFDFSNPATGISLMMGPTSWSPRAYEETCGGSMPYKIMGLAKDAAGLPKAGCRAVLRRSDYDTYVAETVTDTLGIYAFGVADIVTLYYVEVFQASPALAGISVRTLTGA